MLDALQISTIESAMAEEHRRDREALQRLKRFLPNGNGNANHVKKLDAVNLMPSRAISTEDEPEDAVSIIAKVESVFAADAEQKWTVSTMVKHLREIGFPLAAKKPEATMGLVFKKLAKRRRIQLYRRGAGRIPHVYRAMDDAREASEK